MSKPETSIDEEPESCFTSMIDIVFLLLIFFILQPFKQPEMKLRSEMPKYGGPPTVPTDRLAVNLKVCQDPQARDRAYFMVNSERVTDQNRLHLALSSAARHDREVPVTLMPDPEVHFQHVLKAIDQCYIAELTQVAFEAPPPVN